jgi:Toxin YafO, type II toxin-antitoxin system
MVATALVAHLSSVLKNDFNLDGVDSSLFIQRFLEWKQSSEDDSYFFGKDGLNRGSSLVRHVHMVPIHLGMDETEWDKNWKFNRKRTSDRYLFYVDGQQFGYLLLLLVDDPGAHAFLSSSDIEDRKMLSELERWADEFFYFGKII